MKESQTPPPLPEWIPYGADGPYRAVYANGGYTDKRHADALEKLYHSDKLKPVWEGSLGKLLLPADGWSHLIGSLVMLVECAPEGKRATVDSPSQKTKIRKQQGRVDGLLESIAKKAGELSDLLYELEANGGELPAETYSGLALIRSAIGPGGMAKACCGEAFDSFERGLSSYARSYFPGPIAIIDGLASACDEHPSVQEIFSDDPWLSSNQSSWKDYVRVVKDALEECKRMCCSAPSFSDAEWTLLCQELLSLSDLTRQTVTKGLKEL